VPRRDDLQIVAAVTAELAAGADVLDLPAGDGRLSALLGEAGYRVVSADLFPEGCTLAPEGAVAADMNDRLPFASGRFGGIVSQEGVEHLENLGGFLKECRRVLEPGGLLWITTPNFMDHSSRLAFLLSGQKSWRAGLPNEQSTLWGREGERLYHGHAFALPWFQLRYLLRVHGFDDLHLDARGWSTTSRVLHPLLRPLLAWTLARGLKARQRRDRRKGKRAVDDALRKALYREALSRPLLCGKGLLVRARAAGEGKAGEGEAGEGKAGEGKAGEGKAGEGKG
jgi:SAM-dependent methyltransferase